MPIKSYTRGSTVSPEGTAELQPMLGHPFTKDWGGIAGHNVNLTFEDEDPTADPPTNRIVKALINDDDDFDYITWGFYLPENFNGFNGNISVDVYSSGIFIQR